MEGNMVVEWALGHKWVLLFGLLAFLVSADPFSLGPLGEFAHRYSPMSHPIAPYGSVMGSWPRDAGSRLRGSVLHSKGLIHGPESIEFDPRGGGPYTGLADGRVVRWSEAAGQWELFAVPSFRWNTSCVADGQDHTQKQKNQKNQKNQKKKKKVDMETLARQEKMCGRPLGLRFDHRRAAAAASVASSSDAMAMAGDGDEQWLYFTDSYYGLLAVGPHGGVARVLSSSADAEHVLFANDLDIHSNGSIFFTDSSARHNRLDHQRILLETENTGRLLRYDPVAGQTSVVLTGLSFPNGLQLSRDESFLLMTETANCRVLRYWLEGEKKGKVEVFANLPGFPDNVRINEDGQFWVAIDCCRTRIQQVFSTRPWLRKVFFKLPVPISLLYKIIGMRMFTMITLFDEQGNIVDSLEDTYGETVKLVSEVQQKNDTLWIGSVHHKQIAIFTYSK